MNVLIAKTIEECKQWTEVAVIIDVLRDATTVCALLEKGKKELLVFGNVQQAAVFAKEHGEFEIYCEGDFQAAHEDNSPFLASKSNARKPALLVASSSTGHFIFSSQASLLFLGGFCNFHALAEKLEEQNKSILLIPSSLYTGKDDVEDNFCAAALKDCIQGIGNPQEAIIEFNNTMRYEEFVAQGTKTAQKDLKIAFNLDALPVVPQISRSNEEYGVCHPYGQVPSEKWFIQKPESSQPVTAPLPAEPPDDIPPQPLTQEVKAPNPETKGSETKIPKEQTNLQKEKPSASQQADRTEESSLKKESPAVKENLAAAKKAATTRLKGFFSGILQAVKEEKAEFEREIAPKKAQPRKAVTHQSEDLLDQVLKRAEKTSRPKEPVSQEVTSSASSPQQEKQEEKSDLKPRDSSSEVTFSGQKSGFEDKNPKKAIVLFSGGLDSTTCLYWALSQGYECEALTVSYGQRHEREVLAAQEIARRLGMKHHLITLDLPWLSCCSLVDKKQKLPDVAVEDIPKEGIPSTYVPGRNLMFLAIAGSLLDAVGAEAVIAGPNAIDFSGYPDCTPAFFKAAAEALNRGTKTGVSEGIEVLAPLMRYSKAQIVKLAASLKVPFELTWSCYAGGKKPCGHCDSCKLRAKGFAEAGVHDTALD